MADSNLPYFLLGVGVGAALGVLYAPKPGQDMREDLRVRDNEGRDYLRRRTGEFREQAEETIGRGRDAVGSQRDQLAAALEASRKAYKDATGRPSEGEAEAAAG